MLRSPEKEELGPAPALPRADQPRSRWRAESESTGSSTKKAPPAPDTGRLSGVFPRAASISRRRSVAVVTSSQPI